MHADSELGGQAVGRHELTLRKKSKKRHASTNRHRKYCENQQHDPRKSAPVSYLLLSSGIGVTVWCGVPGMYMARIMTAAAGSWNFKLFVVGCRNATLRPCFVLRTTTIIVDDHRTLKTGWCEPNHISFSKKSKTCPFETHVIWTHSSHVPKAHTIFSPPRKSFLRLYSRICDRQLSFPDPSLRIDVQPSYTYYLVFRQGSICCGVHSMYLVAVYP